MGIRYRNKNETFIVADQKRKKPMSNRHEIETHRKLFIRAILKKAVDYNWSLQGFGMLRLYLSKEVRLHIWDSRYQVRNVSVIHDHPWSFISDIISGSITNVLYGEKQGNPTHELSTIQCGEGGGLKKRIGLLRLDAYSRTTYLAGQFYSQGSTALHESIPEPGTISIITREQDLLRSSELATVCYPIGTEWVSAEPRPATVDEVARITAYALVKLEQSL